MHGLMITNRKGKDAKLVNVLKMKMDWLGAKWFVMMVWFQHGRWFRPRFQTARETPAVPFTSLATPGFSPESKVGGESLRGEYLGRKISTDLAIGKY